jgi:hypothetical protein
MYAASFSNAAGAMLGSARKKAADISANLGAVGYPDPKGQEGAVPVHRHPGGGAVGLVILMVPREHLKEETMALASEIAENDPFTLKIMKWACNSAQDAMGFSNSLRNAHSHYMVNGLNSYLKENLEGKDLPKVMAGVTEALKKG